MAIFPDHLNIFSNLFLTWHKPIEETNRMEESFQCLFFFKLTGTFLWRKRVFFSHYTFHRVAREIMLSRNSTWLTIKWAPWQCLKRNKQQERSGAIVNSNRGERVREFNRKLQIGLPPIISWSSAANRNSTGGRWTIYADSRVNWSQGTIPRVGAIQM